MRRWCRRNRDAGPPRTASKRTGCVGNGSGMMKKSVAATKQRIQQARARWRALVVYKSPGWAESASPIGFAAFLSILRQDDDWSADELSYIERILDALWNTLPWHRELHDLLARFSSLARNA